MLSCQRIHPYRKSLSRTSTVDCNVKTGIFSNGGILSFQMEFDIAFRMQMAEQWFCEGVVNTILMHTSWKETHDNCGRPNIMVWSRMVLNFKLGPIIFQKNGPGIGNRVMATHYLDQVLRPHGCYFLHVMGTTLSSMAMPVLILQEPHETFFSKTK